MKLGKLGREKMETKENMNEEIGKSMGKINEINTIPKIERSGKVGKRKRNRQPIRVERIREEKLLIYFCVEVG